MLLNTAHEVILAGAMADTAGLQSWIRENVVTLIILAIGVAMLLMSRKGDVAAIVTVGGGVLVALMFIAMATGNTATELGDWAVGLILPQS